MVSEQFSLKWNDFQRTLSSSFKIHRNEEDFFDVTLVSDDENQVSAHKLLLSSCSTFFKSILRKSSNPHPIIYLSGIDSENLNMVIDYIYHGEVQIYQDQLDIFLGVARKLKIEGLLSSNHQELIDLKKEELDVNLEKQNGKNLNEEDTGHININQDEFVKGSDFLRDRLNTKVTYHENEHIKFEIDFSRIAELDKKIEEMMIIKGGVFTCSICNKINKQKIDMRRHIETHIDGLSFPCSKCAKSFRSRKSLKRHVQIKHN